MQDTYVYIDKSLSSENSLFIRFAFRYFEYSSIFEQYVYYVNSRIELKTKSLVFNTEEKSVGTGNTTFSITSNELVQENTIAKFSEINDLYNDKKIYDLLLDSILDDYKDGIINAKLTVICGDYYDIDGNKVINWQKGKFCRWRYC